MHRFENLILALCSIFIFSACTKHAEADFETDKQCYIAGEKVQLTNRSMYAESYKWTMPDGSTQTNKNAEYTIPINTWFDEQNIFMEAFSKKKRLNKSICKSIQILPVSNFSIYYLNGSHNDYIFNHCSHNFDYVSNYYTLTFYNDHPRDTWLWTESVSIRYSSGQLPSFGTFSLSNHPNINSQEVNINFIVGPADALSGATSTSGVINFSKIEGKIHAVFDSVLTLSPGVKMRGDFYIPY